MQEANLIALEEICAHHQIDHTFIHSLRESGLIELAVRQERTFIDQAQLARLETYIEFHYSLDINLAGIETISHLLRRIHALEEEAILLKNRLQFYEKNR